MQFNATRSIELHQLLSGVVRKVLSMRWQRERERAEGKLKLADLAVKLSPDDAVQLAMEAAEIALKAFMMFKGVFRDFKGGDWHHGLEDLVAPISPYIQGSDRSDLNQAVADVERVTARDDNGSIQVMCIRGMIPQRRYALPDGLTCDEALAREKVKQVERVFRILAPYFPS